ncbi:BglG family transcription antiterminator [Halobacillus litoralis]|uniref:BglG family transcription antiterminator n=1 Tax=Halobacillus litoralis TaxID=45668 RepID=UPI002490AC0D|nr:BglG family transcription antiterminator [Halobacillus litoralis]
MYISARERKVIQLLLEARQDITVKEVADLLDVSTRTVHRDLKGVESILSKHGLKLQKKSGSGLAILGNREDEDALKSSIYGHDLLDYTPEERQVLILSRLLEAKEPVKLLTFANELGVTVATISHDLDKIEDVLKDFQLYLLRKRGYGVEVQGEEANIREAIRFIIMQRMDEHDFLRLLRDNVQAGSPMLDSVSDHLLGLVNKEKISLIEQTVDTIREQLAYPLADSAYIGLVIHLALAIERLQQGEFIQMEEEYLSELKVAREFEAAEKLIEKLEQKFDLDIPEAETGYITMHLMGAKVRYNEDFVLEESSLSVAFKAKQMIEFVSSSIQINLYESKQLLNDLVIHLKPSLYRIQQGMDISNPLKDQIEEDYPELFAVLEKAVQHVFPLLKFPKEETAFLVMHFASALLNMEGGKWVRALVVCSSGIGTAKILSAKLQSQFQEIEEVDHQSLFDLKELDFNDYDLIVSTIPLEKVEDYVLVNPMLPTADVHRIQHRIRKAKIVETMKRVDQPVPGKMEDETLQAIQDSVKSVQRYATVVSQILNTLYVYECSSQDKKEILDRTCERLENEGALKGWESITKYLLDREKVGGLGVPDTGLALYHTRQDHIPVPSFTVIILDHSIAIKGMDGESMNSNVIILMLAPKDISKEGLEVLSFLSSLLIEDPESTKAFQSKEEHVIKNYVSNQIHQFFKEKL